MSVCSDENQQPNARGFTALLLQVLAPSGKRPIDSRNTREQDHSTLLLCTDRRVAISLLFYLTVD